MEKLGDKIKKLREEKSITQKELADALNMSQSTVGMIESNQRGCSNELLMKISEFFDASIDYLLGKVPFKNESEAYYSINVASVKYLLTHKEEIPNYFDIYSGLYRMLDNKYSSYITTYVESLLNKFDENLRLTNLELFELSNIIFAEIKWTKDLDGIVYLKNFEDDAITIRLDFNSIDKIDKNKLNLDDSFLLKSKNFNDDYFLKYESIFSTMDAAKPQDKDTKDEQSAKPATIAAHLPEGEKLTEEEQKQLNDYIQFLLSKREK